MSAQVIDGKAISHRIRDELKQEIEALKSRGVVPGLGVVLVGDDPASASYVRAKEKACEKLGIHSDDNRLPADTSQEELLGLIGRMNEDRNIHGILVQLPLPKHIDESKVIAAIRHDKDVDGFHPYNVGQMVIGGEAFLPCTPHGIIQILSRSGVKTEGAHAVIVGRSKIVGKPLANLLIRKTPDSNCTVTVCHTGTRDISSFTRQADIVIAAAGRPGTITAEMVADGAVVIDVGVNRVEDKTRSRGYRLIGDVDFESVKEKAGMITPVPGGVGPMTITMLLHNTVKSARRHP
jgi:methylenetetrahydrofolate dehydrogenase (NADP+)/methenyltetrahydrofolate cyclohydrolase